jgi:hypothetical protein
MPIQITAEREFIVGQATVIEGAAPEGPFIAVFEDDEITGYFYALDTTCEEQPIQDALQIYNVTNVTDHDKPLTVKVGWSLDNKKVVLLINGYSHAVFDFSSKQGYCRTGFPSPSPANGSNWSHQSHAWSDVAIELFA